MDAGGLVVLGLMWLVLNVLRKAGTRAGGPGKPGQARRPPARPPTATTTQAPRAPGLDPTQREGARLQDLLQELGRTLDQTAGPKGRLPDHRLPSAEEAEDRASLEGTPEAVSLETGPRRAERKVVDQDDEAEALVARRLAAAEAHAEPLRAGDHQAFDARIRQEPADKTATRAYTVARLREAVIWREILGPPVSLREDPPEHG